MLLSLFVCRVHRSGRLPGPCHSDGTAAHAPSDEQDIVNQITDFMIILLHCSSFLIREFGLGNEIGGHQLLCEDPDQT